MNNTSVLKRCPKCGGAISAEAPQGLCPKCLLLQASFPTEAGPKRADSTPPGREELAAAFPQLEILELIGQGGMGFVFKARQAKLDRFVALKILPQSLAGDPAFAERFAREGRLLARLNHPNIVTVYDFGQANGFFYLLMEFVDGVNLRQAMKAGRFTPDQALAIVPRICEALQFAHTEGILHRDIKPENILLDAKGRVKIADFGIAKLLGEPHDGCTLTVSGATLGTVHYMAPEQVEKPAQVDHRADIYSLGVVFYEMLTGELPLGRFAPPSENCPVDPRIDEVVFRALDKKPERRPQSAGEVKTQVETIATRGLSAPAASLPQPRPVHLQYEHQNHNPVPSTRSAWQRIRPGRAALLVSGGVGLALLSALSLAWWVSHWTKPTSPSGLNLVSSEVTTNEPFTKTVVFSRATNQVVGESGETWAVGLWSDTPLQPGERLTARVRQDDEPIGETGCSSLFFIHSQPEGARTSASLSWYFGKVWRKDFGESEAEAAAAQLRDRFSEEPLALTAGKPVELFSVTNESGHVLAGYAEFTRLVSKPPRLFGQSRPKPQAIVHVRSFAAYLPSLSYSVKLPPGYSLQATVNMGSASTHFAPAATPGDYYSSWYIPSPFRQSSWAEYQNYPAQMETQRKALETRFQELQDLGPIPVVLDEPYPVFSLTNKAGEVYRACFELVGPSSPGLTNAPPTAKPRPYPQVGQSGIPVPSPQYLTPQNRRPAPVPMPPRPVPRTMPANSLPPGTIDPATGLPVGPGGPASSTIDPATGLPASLIPKPPLVPSRLQRTNAPATPARN